MRQPTTTATNICTVLYSLKNDGVCRRERPQLIPITQIDYSEKTLGRYARKSERLMLSLDLPGVYIPMLRYILLLLDYDKFSLLHHRRGRLVSRISLQA